MVYRDFILLEICKPCLLLFFAKLILPYQIAEHYGFKDKYVVKQLLTRERRKERKLEAGIVPRPKGRPRKDGVPRDIMAEQAYEIQRLRMENKLLRDFLHYTGRK